MVLSSQPLRPSSSLAELVRSGDRRRSLAPLGKVPRVGSRSQLFRGRLARPIPRRSPFADDAVRNDQRRDPAALLVHQVATRRQQRTNGRALGSSARRDVRQAPRGRHPRQRLPPKLTLSTSASRARPARARRGTPASCPTLERPRAIGTHAPTTPYEARSDGACHRAPARPFGSLSLIRRRQTRRSVAGYTSRGGQS